jgi:anti-anti-sigma factor
MPTRIVEATVRHKPAVAIIDLVGEIDAAAERTLQTAYAEAKRQNPGAILLNFGAVDYINSTGIALIVGLLAQARKSHCRLIAYSLSAHYMEIFRITRLADYMSVFPDEITALTKIGDQEGESHVQSQGHDDCS